MSDQPPVRLTYADLVGRLVDLRALAQRPVAGEHGAAATSYDRRSRYDPVTDTYENWGANDDGSGYLRRDGSSIVVFDADGPGVIWRIWSALPGDGHVRVFIDGATEPVVDQPFRALFDSFADECCPANFPELSSTLSRGRNRWIPLAYQQHATIVLDEGWGAYYHFTYSTFPSTWQVPSFDGSYGRDDAITLAETDRALARARRYRPAPPGSVDRRVSTTTIPARASTTVAAHEGSGAITALRVRIDGLARLEPQQQRRLLRLLTITIGVDDDPTPSVWAPLGDFFGSAPGLTEHRTLPLSAGSTLFGDAEFDSAWYMPFSRGVRIDIGNDDQDDVRVSVECDVEPLDRARANGLLRFHAKWHRGDYQRLDAARFVEGGDRWPDWPLLQVTGPGRFCGMHLHVYNAWHQPGADPRTWWYGRWDHKTIDWWWGEGDEKFFVDGETFPSTFGTGSEDYVGYAWAAEPPFPTFDSAFAAQPYVELNANGHTNVSRFHVADNIPFTESFAGFLEKYKGDVWGDGNTCLFAATAYWYAAPGIDDGYPAVPAEQRWGYCQLPS